MSIDVHFTPAEFDPASVADATVVVIDVVRASTTIVEALAGGARGVFPVDSTEEAVRLATSLGREDTLLCGERKGVKIEGFDLGNSPAEIARSDLEGLRVVMTTTNGTPVLRAADEARRVLIGAFTNLSAVARAVAGDERVVLQCAGREGRFGFDDALCAGHLLLKVRELTDVDLTLNDPARAACTLAEGIDVSPSFLRSTAAGRAVEAVELGDDLEICAAVDRHDLVPVLEDGAVTVMGG